REALSVETRNAQAGRIHSMGKPDHTVASGETLGNAVFRQTIGRGEAGDSLGVISGGSCPERAKPHYTIGRAGHRNAVILRQAVLSREIHKVGPVEPGYAVHGAEPNCSIRSDMGTQNRAISHESVFDLVIDKVRTVITPGPVAAEPNFAVGRH